ncbi:MAG: DM13 domain-containing protein [Pseudomonadota bacterium]
MRKMTTRAALATAVSIPLLMSAPALAGEAGTFTGASNHITTGGVSIVETSAGKVVLLAADFSLDGAPDPRVGLGKDGKYDEATDMGELRSINGLQAYAVPDGVDVSGYNEVYIWCRKFSVPLGVASLD